MKDKRLLCWLLGVTTLCGVFVSTQVGKAGPFTTAQPRVPGDAGAWPADTRALCSLQPQPKPDPRKEPEEAEGEEARPDKEESGLRKLTPQEINYLRYMELRGMRKGAERPDRVTVKIPRQTQIDFLLAMQGNKDFDSQMARLGVAGGQTARQVFLRLTAPQKLHYIASHMGVAYADRVEITSDPEAFIDFKKNVMPIVIRSCGTRACHGSIERDVGRLAIFNDPKKSASTTYANFLMLNEIEVNGHRLINRGQPDNSLLLTYMLPPEDVKPELRHPGEAMYKPVFRSPTALKYRRIRAWIESLKHPYEDYGIHFFPPSRPTTQPMDDLEKPPEPRPGPEKAPEPGQEKQGQQTRPASTPDSQH
jgi:hypothetical protein